MYEFFDFDYKNAVFEWDDNKADINFKKHGIRFETAVKIFADDNKLIRYDEEHPQEERYNILQYTQYKLIGTNSPTVPNPPAGARTGQITET